MTDFTPGTTAKGTPCKTCVKLGRRCHAHPREAPSTEPSEAAPMHGAPKCGAKTKTTGKPCGNPAGFKTDHVGYGRCHLHGGCAPSGKKAAKRQMAEAAVITYGLQREIDPHEALLEQVYWTAGHVDYLRQKVQAIEDRDLVWGVTRQRKGVGPEGPIDETEWRAELNVWLKLYREERKDLESICKTAIACGIAERQVKLAEEQGRLIADVIKRVLEDLGVADHPDAQKTVRRHLLRAIDGGKAA